MTGTEESHNTIKSEPGVDVIEKSNLDNNEKTTKIRNARCKRVLLEPIPFEEKFILSVRDPTLGILQRLFTKQATVGVLYYWVCSLNDYPIYFRLAYLSTELKPTERLASYRDSVLNMSECIEPVWFEDEEDCFRIAFTKIAFCMAMKSWNVFLQPTTMMKFQVNRFIIINVIVINFKEQLSLTKNDLPLFSDGSCLIFHRRPVSFWVLLFKQNFVFRRHTCVVCVGECFLDLIESFCFIH